jgi:hypothetical protein
MLVPAVLDVTCAFAAALLLLCLAAHLAGRLDNALHQAARPHCIKAFTSRLGALSLAP